MFSETGLYKGKPNYAYFPLLFFDFFYFPQFEVKRLNFFLSFYLLLRSSLYVEFPLGAFDRFWSDSRSVRLVRKGKISFPRVFPPFGYAMSHDVPCPFPRGKSKFLDARGAGYSRKCRINIGIPELFSRNILAK